MAHAARATVHLHSQEDCDYQRIGEAKELLPPPGQAFGKTSSTCLSPNKHHGQGFSKENHCSLAPVPTSTREQLGDLRKVSLPLLHSPSFHPAITGGVAVNYFTFVNTFSNLF